MNLRAKTLHSKHCLGCTPEVPVLILSQFRAKVLRVYHKSFLCFYCGRMGTEHHIFDPTLYYLFFSTGKTYCLCDYSLYLCSTKKWLLWGHWKSLWEMQEITDWSQNEPNSLRGGVHKYSTSHNDSKQRTQRTQPVLRYQGWCFS